MEDVELVGPIISYGEDCKITHASSHEDLKDVQHSQSTLKLRESDEPLNGPQIGLGFVEYENRNESLLPKQHAKFEIQIVGPTNFKGPNFESKHASIHEESINVEHQESSKLSRLNYKQLDGPKLQHAKHQGVVETFLDKLEELSYMDLSKVAEGKNRRGKSMTHEETLILLQCKEGGHFCKGSGGATNWNLISEEIEKKLGSRPSADQCRLRYDTLLKAYKTYEKYCMKTGKTFCAITKEERLDLKVATTLCEEWYTIIGKICEESKSRKRMKTNPSVYNDLHPLRSQDSSSLKSQSSTNLK